MITDRRQFVDDYNSYMDKLSDRLQLLKNRDDGSQWLQTLYMAYTQRFVSDNERIWGSTQVLLPLAVTALAGMVAIQNPSVLDLVVLLALSLSSAGVSLLGLLVTEQHRAFQLKSLAWLAAIELTIGLNSSDKRALDNRIADDRFTRVVIAYSRVRWIRRILYCSVAALSLFVAYMTSLFLLLRVLERLLVSRP